MTGRPILHAGEIGGARPDTSPQNRKGVIGTMKTLSSHASRWMIAAASVAALGFGAAQALAAPAQGDDARVCQAGPCRKDCIAQGDSGGICIDGQCICFIE